LGASTAARAHHRKVLLLQIRHREEVAHLADRFARAPDLVRIGAEEVLPQHEAAFHALERLEVLPLLLKCRAGLVDPLQREQLSIVGLTLLLRNAKARSRECGSAEHGQTEARRCEATVEKVRWGGVRA
jgi:hypothetical protein